MKRLSLIFLLLSFWSCDYFDKKKVYTEDILKEELQAFNWNDVDEYPTFASCDSTLGKENKRHCFENTLRTILNTNLSKHQIVVSQTIEDTVILKVIIDNQGHFSIHAIESDSLTKEEIPELDSLLKQSLDSLPKIYPAIKRSQQVTTQFNLPVIIRVEE
ncbi:hypothetical protein [uncultured Psychroserpens sp.]|uniref:hypothetical protein n=1 Tax=uncultured Psychroserpens sp. TaxID=255436 RepID=UPI002602715D|nr:hypothetical protein [uncultured Psychroserpens sp.]